MLINYVRTALVLKSDALKSDAFKLDTLRSDKRAVTAIEYGLIAALVAVVIIVSIGLVGTNLGTVFNKVASELV